MSMSVRRHLPNALTLTNLLCGAAALVVLLTQGDPALVLVLLSVALVADLLDGRVARALGVSGPLGAVLDSLADLVSFGLVPAAAIAMASEAAPSPLAMVAGAAIVCAAGYRLARFTAEALTLAGTPTEQVPPAKPAFKGLPVTIPAAILVGATVSGINPPPGVLAITAIVLSALMVSRVPFRSFKDKPLVAVAAPVLFLAAVFSVAVGSTVFGVGTTLALGGLAFVLFGLAHAVRANA